MMAVGGGSRGLPLSAAVRERCRRRSAELLQAMLWFPRLRPACRRARSHPSSWGTSLQKSFQFRAESPTRWARIRLPKPAQAPTTRRCKIQPGPAARQRHRVFRCLQQFAPLLRERQPLHMLAQFRGRSFQQARIRELRRGTQLAPAQTSHHQIGRRVVAVLACEAAPQPWPPLAIASRRSGGSELVDTEITIPGMSPPPTMPAAATAAASARSRCRQQALPPPDPAPSPSSSEAAHARCAAPLRARSSACPAKEPIFRISRHNSHRDSSAPARQPSRSFSDWR